MPDRMTKESVCTSESLAKISDGAERLFHRLKTKADDYGTFQADPRIIRSFCFPLQLDQFPEDRIWAMLWELATAKGDDGTPIIVLYRNSGSTYGQYVNFQKHNRFRARRHKWPSFDDTCQQLLTSDSRCQQRTSDDDNCRQMTSNDGDCQQLLTSDSSCRQMTSDDDNCRQMTSNDGPSYSLSSSLSYSLPLLRDPSSTDMDNEIAPPPTEDDYALSDEHRQLAIQATPDHALANDITYANVKAEHAKQFAILRHKRKKSTEQIREMMGWAFADPFWADKIQIRPAKLDEHWDTMAIQRKNNGRARASPKSLAAKEELEPLTEEQLKRLQRW